MNLSDRIVRLGAYAVMPHFTVGVMALVCDESNKYLMVRNGIRQVGSWGFPGGFVRRRETPETSLARELEEEVQVLPMDPRFVVTYKQPWARHYDLVYSVRSFRTSSRQRKSRREVTEIAWLSPDEINALERRTREADYFLSAVGLE